jgi:hypothetical protein
MDHDAFDSGVVEAAPETQCVDVSPVEAGHASEKAKMEKKFDHPSPGVDFLFLS